MRRTFALLTTLILGLSGLPALAHAKPASGGPQKASPQPRASQALASVQKSGVQKAGARKAAAKPCYARPVQLMRVRGDQLEPREVSLTMCSGAPNPSALDSISVLGRPRDVERPLLPEIRAYRALPLAGKVKGKVKSKKVQNPGFVSEGVLRLHPGLLVRLQQVAKHWPGKTIEIISGYRPDARDTSRHHHGRALDLRVAGVTRERLRDYLRTFEDTGVGYYPNSFFVHMDVRDTKGFWIDRSGPGEVADYGPWPLTPSKQPALKRAVEAARDRNVDRTRDSVLKGALADLESLRGPLAQHSDRRTAMNGALLVQPSPKHASKVMQESEGEDMSQDEVKRAREEARRALEEL